MTEYRKSTGATFSSGRSGGEKNDQVEIVVKAAITRVEPKKNRTEL